MPDEGTRKDETVRTEILQAARDLFLRFGLAKTTMEEIAKASGKGKSTLYYYYTSKEEIFSATLQEDIDETLRQVNAAVAQAPTAEAKLMAFTQTRVRIIRKTSRSGSPLYKELPNNPAPLTRIRKGLEAPIKSILKNILLLGFTTGEFKHHNDIDLLTQALFSTLRGLESTLLESPQPTSSSSSPLTETIISLLCNGLKPLQPGTN